ncbi:hypothetical protein [Sphingomonas arantia]
MTLLSDRLRNTAAAMTNAADLLDLHLGLPTVRLELFFAQLVIDLPVVGLLLSVALGVHALGQRKGHDLARALPWLRRAAVFALVAAPLIPLGESIRTTVLMQAFGPPVRFYLSMEFQRLVLNLLLALVALAVTWALAAGLRAEQDLAEIV